MSGSIIKRVNEDTRLRPFLSTHFNAQEFIKTVITQEGRSEGVFVEISGCIDDVNEEIKSYITQHKDSLMSGMQDVATLSEKYATLSTTSQKLHRTVDRLKKEALQSYDLVKQRTSELERIHSASTSLRYLRQFSHAKSQLDHLLKGIASSGEQQTSVSDIMKGGGAGMDIRQLATAAKTISDLEQLLDLPALSEISYVAEHASSIRQFGQQLRRRSQDRLLSSLKERDQASVASSLQVFFNLQTLPEVVLLAIDTTVKLTAEVSRSAIDLDGVVAAYPELASAHTGTRAAAVAAVLGGGAKTGQNGPASQSQVRVALREAAHQWASLVHDQAMQIHVLQRVVSKKEDPATHKRFLDVLRVRAGSGAVNHLLASGRLLDLFWERLNESLQEIATEKVKSQPLASNRIYPHLRKAAVEVVENLRALSARDLQRDQGGTAAGLSSSGEGGMFGSLALPQDELLRLLGVTAKRGGGRSRGGASRSTAHSSQHPTSRSASSGQGHGHDDSAETGLVKGLAPMRDRFLVGCYTRMVHPVTQMFPEMEGYTAAVPSKRDLQALTKALQTELATAAAESEVGLLRAVSREALKAVQLMVTKIEGMIVNNSDALRQALVLNVQGQFPKNTSQDHNSQLMVLLGNLKEALEKMPQTVLKAAQESPGSALSSAALLIGGAEDLLQSELPGPSSEAATEAVLSELKALAASATVIVEELAARELISPLVEVLASHAKSLLFSLPKEGVAQAPSSGNKNGEVECSRAAQAVVKQLPELTKTHLGSLPKSALVTAATEELCIRVMHAYISTAALVRPVTEASRMRAAKDMAALEVMVGAIAPGVNVRETCPVVQEYKCVHFFLAFSLSRNLCFYVRPC